MRQQLKRTLQDSVVSGCPSIMSCLSHGLMSPYLQAGEATKLEHADEVMRQNALELAQRSEHQMAAPQILLNMGLVPPAAALPVPAPAPAPELHLHLNNRDNAVRCTIM